MKCSNCSFFSLEFRSKLVVLSLFLMVLTACGASRKHKAALHFEHATAALEQKKPLRALTHLTTACTLDPLPQYLALKATVLYQLGNLQASQQIYAQIVARSDISHFLKTDVLNNYASCLYRQGKHTSAQHIWLKLTRDPHYQTQEVAWFNLGMCSLGAGKKETNHATRIAMAQRAVKQFEHALQQEPAYVDALYFQAEAYLLSDNSPRARTALKKVISLTPHHVSAQQLLKNLGTA